MKKDPKELAENIIALVMELAELAAGGNGKVIAIKTKHSLKGNGKETSGATGGLRVLIDEGYFDTPKQLPEIIERLKQEGRHYSNATISMGLLNLVRERVLTRFRDKGDKKWKYVIRK
ncbi:MAG: hypothetical protein PHE24_03340 [Patescibacteria group bacterium]|nr:hypothetical protein [Patescibacteria group bacterium]